MDRIARVGVLLILILFIFSPILAQNPPPGQEAGPQAERFKSEVEQKKQELEKKETKAPEIEIEERKEEPLAEGISFVLKEVTITGATLFAPEDFYPIYQPFLNKKITFRDLEEIVEKIKGRYKEKGYLTTIVYIPEQEILEGKIEIRVIEGRMGKLNVEGNNWFSASLIERFFHIKKNDILNVKKLQRDILRLNKNSDLEVKAVISPGEEPGASDINLKVKDKFPWHMGAGFDNQGTRLAGKLRSSLSFRSSNATGNFDSLFINSLLSSNSFGESVSYTFPVGTYGTSFGLDFTYFKMQLGKEYKPFDINGTTRLYTPYISWELALSEVFEAYANTGIKIKSIKKKINGDLTSDDQLRLPYFAFVFTKIDSSGGQTTFSPELIFGTEDFLGASSRNHPSASRQGTGGKFFKYEHSLTRIQRMPFESYMLLRSQFQTASRTLPSSEQFQIGGANSVRGYPEGDYLADIGGSLSLDWVFPMYFIPKDWKLSHSDMPLRYQIQPVIFVDLGGGKLKKVLPGETRHKFLVGIGGGLRIHLFSRIYLRLEWAEHVGDRPVSGAGPATFHVTFQTEI